MAKRLLIDADVLIDYSRKADKAVAYIDNLSESFLLSAITVGEIYGGVREGHERRLFDVMIDAVKVLPVTLTVATEGGLLRREYFSSHGTGLVDAILAATAEAHDLQLVTLNKKHFPMLDNVIAPYRKN